MKFICLAILLVLSVGVYGQSGRVAPADLAAQTGAPELTVKQMFDEANGYSKAKFNEYAVKKVPYTDALLARTKLEQRQLAAKYAAAAGQLKELTADDLYYLGMLHWIAENLDGAAENLARFISADGAPVDRSQTARSIIIVVKAKQRKLVDAEKLLSDYLAKEPRKLTEQARMEGELAKAYQSEKDFLKMTPHAVAGYEASKALLKDSSSRARGLDEILDAGMLVFEAYRDSGQVQKAEAALDELRATGAATGSSGLYYYAVDCKIKFLIDTGRKAVALQLYKTSLANVAKELLDKDAQNEVITRLRKREKHYALLGSVVPEFAGVNEWFPGARRTFADMRGKVVLLDFWAIWCGPCFDAFPSLIEWQQDLKADGLEILGVTRFYGEINGIPADEAREMDFLKGFRTTQNLKYDFVVAKDQSIQYQWGATALPTVALIDRKGVVRYLETGTSSIRLVGLREMLQKLLAEK